MVRPDAYGRLKGIPYEPEDRGDGHPNLGFRPLKDRIDLCEQIPEAADEPAFLDALRKLNARRTAFFTAGCEKAYNERGALRKPIGFLELAFNSRAEAQERDQYGRVLARLDGAMERGYAEPIDLEFIITPTRFRDHGFDGYSMAIYFRSDGYRPEEEALRLWRRSIAFVTKVLCGVRASKGPVLYRGGRVAC